MYERIWSLAKKEVLSIPALEELAKVSQSTISKWKTVTPKADALFRVAVILHTTVEYLLTGIEKPAPTDGDGPDSNDKVILDFLFSLPYERLRGILVALAAPKVFDVLESAVDASVDNLPKLPGTTVIAIDVSGSMGSNISAKSDIRCCEIATMLGMIANRICENSIVYTFDTYLKKLNVPSRTGILYATLHNSCPGGGTSMSLPFQEMIHRRIKADRVIILSDNECNSGYSWYHHGTVQSLADEYRRTTGNDIWVHAIDLQGYGTQQFHGAKTNIIAGWSEKVFDFILLAEQGEGNLEKTIAAYRW